MNIDTLIEKANNERPDAVLLFSLPDTEVKRFVEKMRHGCRIVVASPTNPPSYLLMDHRVLYRKISPIPDPGVALLVRVKDFFVSAMAEGVFRPGQRVLCFARGDLDVYMEVDTSNLGIPSLIDLVQDRVDLSVLEATMEMASTIAREGREGYPAGALFIVGDERRVIKYTIPLIQTPFGEQGRPVNILNRKDEDTVKGYATMDGAVIVGGDGSVVSAGRYVMVQNAPLRMKEGLGGRHLAAAYITQVSRAIAILVSSSGAIRVFKDGKIIYEVKRV